MLAVGLWAVVLLVVAADEDCSLLVVNSTMGHRMYTKDGDCAEKAGDPGTTLWDNVLEFEGIRGATLHSVRFYPTWYAFPPGQPIRKDCVTWGDRTYLTFRVGRWPSHDVRDEFMYGTNKSNILKSHASGVKVARTQPSDRFTGMYRFRRRCWGTQKNSVGLMLRPRLGSFPTTERRYRQ